MPQKFTQTKLLIASGNQGKVMEIRELMSEFNVQIIAASEFDIAEPEEIGKTFIENAELKARYYGGKTGLPALADDSGLCVDALNGEPGIYSARWAGADKNFAEAISRVQTEMTGKDNNKAKFVCALSLYWPNLNKMESVEGSIDGTLTFPQKGKGGFGYDPIFIPKGYNETFGELHHEVKQKISHRAVAFDNLIKKCFR
ncbi:MAG: Xanthosine triphosphate pyrophosphatase [Rickettsiaceae bacterium]|nr:Xanthosine triphosphate pyrophosphatase [Rickettsiaceae bacterium]